MENQSTLMGEFLLVLKESLRKQAFSVILLICACGGLWYIRTQDKESLDAKILKLENSLAECSDARISQAVEIATLKVSISILQSKH